MRFFSSVLLLAATAGSLVAAVDHCPPKFCEVGETCNTDPDGPHCCSKDAAQVLQCKGTKWEVRNACDPAHFCTCTNSSDLICKKQRVFQFAA
ncbi:hypothetical protein PG990_015402 [Apiospora arundinis]|uniref:AvrStb6 n=1 Tax=Apiospora arundinis TaxID=335852 RepID=A0ABR2HMS2_9PEZI